MFARHSFDPRVKVLNIIARLNVGGAALHAINLSAFLDANRFESQLVSGSENPGEGSMLDYALAQDVRPLVISEMIGQANLKARDLNALIRLYRMMRLQKPHIVHTHTAKAGFLGRVAARWAKVPIIIHTYHGHVLRGYYGASKTCVLRLMERALGYATARIIAVSNTVCEELIAYKVATRQKISVVPLGFDLEPFLNCKDVRGQFHSELGLDGSLYLIGVVGRIFPIKNHRLFLDSAARVLAQEQNARFIVVGDGTLRGEMEGHARQLGIADRVFFTGWRRDLARIYADLDVLVVSSNNEGTPVSAIEAMASGCPVVATRVGGLPDLILDGENGYLVPPGDSEQLAARILTIIQDGRLASRLGQFGRAMAKQQFGLKRLIRDIEALYEGLLAAKGLSL